MSFQVSKLPEPDRRPANFHPSIWGDHFLAYAPELVVKIPSSSSFFLFFFFFSVFVFVLLLMLFLMR